MAFALADRIDQQLDGLTGRARTDALRALGRDILEAIRRGDWSMIGRPEQLEPTGDWLDWWITGGRGSGKTRPGAEYVHKRALDGRLREGVLIGPTAADLRDTMVQGPSGIMHTGRDELRPIYEPSKRLLTWPNGSICHTRSAEDPDSIRGLNLDTAWVDEPGTFRYGLDVQSNLKLSLRNRHTVPRTVYTTTPRSVPLVQNEIHAADDEARQLAEHGYIETQAVDFARLPEEIGPDFNIADYLIPIRRTSPRVVLSRMSTYENLHNLSPSFIDEVVVRYAGTRLGLQELLGQLLDTIGVLFQRAWFLDRLIEQPWPPSRTVTWVRRWDLAATEPHDRNTDPDWTVGTLMARDSATRPPRILIADIVRFRATPGVVEDRLVAQARSDGPGVKVVIAQDPAQAGKAQIEHYRQLLQGIAPFEGQPESGDKLTRASGISGAAEQGRVYTVQAAWNLAMFDELEDFDGTSGDGRHDDIVDTLSGGFNFLEQRGRPSTLIPPKGTLPVRDTPSPRGPNQRHLVPRMVPSRTLR